MSRGPGAIEERIAALFAATRDRALSIEEITRHAFGLDRRPPTRVQRLSATRAAHRLLRRVREADERAHRLAREAHAALGQLGFHPLGKPYQERLKAHPAWVKAQTLFGFCERIGTWSHVTSVAPGRLRSETEFWCTTTINGRLYFHPPDAPLRVYAVALGPGGISWTEAPVTRITARNVMALYAGETARLDRFRLWQGWAFWRGVQFVSSRSGRIAKELDDLWWQRYGATGSVPPDLQMPLAEAMALLGVPADYTKADVLRAFRIKAKTAHPDAGGTSEMFRVLVEARDRLLKALGTEAPPPKPPRYAPQGSVVVYRRYVGGSQPRRLGGSTRPRLA
jgi:hypothetical protein